jgi:hypothetical protein
MAVLLDWPRGSSRKGVAQEVRNGHCSRHVYQGSYTPLMTARHVYLVPLNEHATVVLCDGRRGTSGSHITQFMPCTKQPRTTLIESSDNIIYGHLKLICAQIPGVIHISVGLIGSQSTCPSFPHSACACNQTTSGKVSTPLI